jgi:hypothetical protein
MFPALKSRWCLVIVATAIASGASAQTGTYDPRSYITDKEIRFLQSQINTIIEPHQSPVSIPETRRLVISSVLSALAEKCKVPWAKQIYLPMMAYFRHSKKLNERQMTLVGMLHGAKQGYILADLPAGPCPLQIREQISRAMSKQNQ